MASVGAVTMALFVAGSPIRTDNATADSDGNLTAVRLWWAF